MLESAFKEFLKFFTLAKLQTAILIVLVAVAGFILLKILSSLVDRMTRKYVSQQYSMLIRKAIQYTGWVIILFIILQLIGVKITALLGAAGIVGIAVGFASQTSMSNLISGLFLISEKPFEIGDVIKVGDNSGIILSIDLLSVKIKTFDNQYIRIPNSVLLNTELTNVTRFPIRRMDIKLAVTYKTDINHLKELLLSIARSNPYCLDEPEPLIVFTDFGESGLEFLFGVWFYKSDFLDLKNSVMQQIKERFQAEEIEFAFPHRTLYTGSVTAPFPVALVNDAETVSLRNGETAAKVARSRAGRGKTAGRTIASRGFARQKSPNRPKSGG